MNRPRLLFIVESGSDVRLVEGLAERFELTVLARQIEDAGSARYTREVISQDPRFEVVEVVDTLTVLRRCAGDLKEGER